VRRHRNGRRCATPWPPFSGYTGVTGEIRFSPGSGDPVKSAVIMQVKGDRFTWVMKRGSLIGKVATVPHVHAGVLPA
jgi:hypothetical protein